MKFPDVLDCIGRGFPQEWTALYDALRDGESRRRGDEAAVATVGRWSNRSAAAFAALPTIFIGLSSQRELGGFCPHGYCAAVLRAADCCQGGETIWQGQELCASWGGAWWTWRFIRESRWAETLGILNMLEFGKWRFRRRRQRRPTSARSRWQRPPCPDGGLRSEGRCWYLGAESTSCAAACRDRGLEFLFAEGQHSYHPLTPRLVGRELPARAPLGYLECYIEQEGAFHLVQRPTSPDVYIEKVPRLADWSPAGCRLACPCTAPARLLANAGSTDRYFAGYRLQLDGALAATLPREGAGFPARFLRRPFVRIAGFGVHLTTLLEPISAIRRVLPQTLAMMSVFYGASHPLPESILPDVCPGTGNFRCAASAWPGDNFWMRVTDSHQGLQGALDALTNAIENDDYLLKADFLVCGGGHAPVLCMLIRMVTGLPIFFNLQAPLSFRMSKNPDIRVLLASYFREMARPSFGSSTPGRTVMSTSLIFFQRQFWVQTGRLLPIVRNQNFYASVARGPGVAGAVEGAAIREILFWQHHIALKGDCALAVWRFVKQVWADDSPYNLVFKNMARLPGARHWRRVYALGPSESMSLTYADMFKRFSAAVIFPHDLGMISFDDLYALSIPLFLPDDSLVVTMAFSHVASTENYPWYLIRQQHADIQLPRPPTEALAMPWDPGWRGAAAVNGSGREVYCGRGEHDLGRLAEAVAVSNFALFPHVRRFSSLTDLLEQLRSMSPEELARTSLAMRRTADEAWEVTAEFYRRALWHLLEIGPE